LNDLEIKYGFAYTNDFIAHMQAASSRDLTGFFADWYYGQGFPTYTVSVGQSPDYTTSVTIYQSQSDASVSFFELPVPIQFWGGGKDTIIVFNNTFSGEVFAASTGFAIDSVKFDPDLWLISAHNTVTLGKNELPAGKTLVLQPNPANDFLYVKHNLGKILSLEILSLDGKQVTNPKIVEEGKGLKINIQQLKPGMYLLRINYPEGIVTRKLLINR